MSTSEAVLEKMDLNRIFHDDLLQFDLRGGVIVNPAKSRVCLLTTDLLKGIYRGLVDEAGVAWKPILGHCGTIWGERVAQRLDRECQSCLGVAVADLALGHYLEFINGYFTFHGWGRMELKLEQALTRGLVEAELHNSIFAQVVEDSEEMADPMIAGMLGSMLAKLSGHPLDCVQTTCKTKGSDRSRFIITAKNRLKQAEQQLKLGSTHESLVQSL